MTIDTNGIVAFIDDIKIKDGGTIGSATTPEAITIASNGKVSLSGDLQVDGTTTTVNSTTVTVDDPIFTLGGDTASGSDDNKDRGIEFRYNDGSDRIGFFGYDDSESSFTFMTAASNASEVFSGTAGNLLAGNISPAAGDGGTLGTASLEWSDLYLADEAVVYFGDDQDVTLTHVADTGLILKHTATGDNTPIILTLQTGETDITADEPLGTINFQAPDETGGTDAILVAAAIEAVAEGTFAADNNATKLSFKTGASEAAAEKMSISSVGNVTMKNTAVGDDTPMVLSLLSGETDIAASDVIGKIEWSAPDEGTGTDAILVCGAVDVVSEGDFSATNNATKMSFRLGSSETATEKMQLSSAGALQVDGSLTCTPTSTLLIKDSSGSTLKTVYGVASN